VGAKKTNYLLIHSPTFRPEEEVQTLEEELSESVVEEHDR
jgi:hypothetical protein